MVAISVQLRQYGDCLSSTPIRNFRQLYLSRSIFLASRLFTIQKERLQNDLRARLDMSTTTLLAFFKYNSEKEDGREYLYQEFPEHFVYERHKGWSPRKQRFSIGRMWSASPFNGERYYLRLLLTVVRGARSFEDLRTVDGVEYPTFKGACITLRLLEDDGEWIAMFRDGQAFMTGRAFRHLFALALQHTTLTHPLGIWEEFKESFCDDLAHLLVTGAVLVPAGGEEMGEGLTYDYGLYHIQEFLNEYGRSLTKFGLPQAVLDWRQNGHQIAGSGGMGEERDYNREQEQTLFDSMREKAMSRTLSNKSPLVPSSSMAQLVQARPFSTTVSAVISVLKGRLCCASHPPG